MYDPNKLCLGCMRELKEQEKVCPECQFSVDKYNQERSSRVLPLGTILSGKYLIGRVLGEGGFGITYLAWDLNKEEKIAVKEYFPAELAYRDTVLNSTERVTASGGAKRSYYEKGLKSFAQEAQNLQKFNWVSGIVSIRDYFYENNTAYIVMEYVEGKTLSQVMKEGGGPVEWKHALELTLPVLDALAVIHEYQIIHRDISPDNIIVGDDGKVTLIDFGAARIQTGNETKSMTITLKHGYAPIEQYQSRGRQGPWTDIYAMCATMYHLMSGRLPPNATERVMGAHLTQLAHLKPQIPQRISEAIARGMEVESGKRYQKVQELKIALYRTEASDAAISKGNQNKDKSGIKKRKYRKTAWFVLGVDIGLLGLFFIYITFLSHGSLNKFQGTEFNGHTYAVIDRNISWQEAKSMCEEAGGYLATVTSEKEEQFLEELITEGDMVFYWLGGRSYKGGDTYWITGEKFTYEDWAEGQPDYGVIDGEYENYIGLTRVDTAYTRANTWNDYRNMPAEKHGYICEWD